MQTVGSSIGLSGLDSHTRGFRYSFGVFLNSPVGQVKSLDEVRSAWCNKYLVSRIGVLNPVACWLQVIHDCDGVVSGPLMREQALVPEL
jgi:hypothetical protein